ncbi:unnamed protein product [Tuber melanosporum]|uniref:(Perigord truffle) hypothetical protein n=1 Tax=Tuber melanosporum (strain Mel28) TaxID=656061 RepID=D5GCB6_TUBMM|nr:uncharacterized protein GSTUM_00005806001 [Tuber melanosporum]CAZ82159.1 unnamed protein product [Tuber melanosporum]
MLQNSLHTSSPLSPLSSPISPPPTAEPTAPHQDFSSSSSNPPHLSTRQRLPSSYKPPYTRPRSAEPVGFRSPVLVSQGFGTLPTLPATNSIPTTLSSADIGEEEEEDLGHEGVSLSAADQSPSAPSRSPPPPPRIDITPAHSERADMPFKLPQQQKREGPSPRHKPTPAPVPRYQALETPVPSTLSRAMNKDGIVRPASANANPIPAFSLPPSPPLTRRSTVVQSVRSSAPKYAPSLPPLQPSRSLAPGQDGTLLGRPSTSSSSSTVSVREVTKLGKALGRQPIDYLIPYGALDVPVSDNFHPYQDPHSLTNSPKTELPVADVFGNLNYLLESYLGILSNGGSMAVGTGYRSVARKLLQQVGGVFNREVGVEGIDWSDILEYIRGDEQKPCLCVLPVKGLIQRNIDTATILSGAEPASEVGLQAPQQTKELAESVVAGVREKSGTGKVQEWLEEVEKVLRQQPPPSPTVSTVPEEVEHEYEDEVVTQIIEGILPTPAQIEVFRSYLTDHAYLASTRAALMRLYPQHPAVSITKPIVALYLLLHVELHPMLAAIGGLSDAEMELINSGRFDGFLDGSTNAVPRDEEEELGCITDLHKKLARVMYTLDDELAELHNRALIVRQALKERIDAIATRMKKKAPESEYGGDNTVVDGGEDVAVGGEDEQDDLLSPLVPVEEWDGGKSILLSPDDSASNVHFSRRRREARQEMEESEKKRAEKKERKEIKRREEERRAGRHEPQEDCAASTTVSKRRKEKKGERRDRRSGEGTESGSSTKRGRSRRRGEGEEQDGEREKKEHKERKDEHRERKEERESRREERESRREEKERELREKDKKDKSWSRALGGINIKWGEKAGDMGAVAPEKERKG